MTANMRCRQVITGRNVVEGLTRVKDSSGNRNGVWADRWSVWPDPCVVRVVGRGTPLYADYSSKRLTTKECDLGFCNSFAQNCPHRMNKIASDAFKWTSKFA